MNQLKYRKELDGLRAVAVLSVLAFHAGVPWLQGGYLGVDIFFVISGFLITSIIMHDLAADSFSFSRFYEKRARRILPALFLVISACIPVAWYSLGPDSLENFGQSIVATIAFSNNILLWLTAGYWDLASEFKPLLHTWSLGVEEQFYLLYPALLLLSWPVVRRRPLASFIGFVIIALIVAGLSHQQDARMTFYSLHTRAWELLLGAACTASALRPSQRLQQLMSIIGAALVISSFFMLTEEHAYEMKYLLIPTVGTAFVILGASEGTLVYWALTRRLVVVIGLASYSIYLWHQPMLAFARVNSAAPPTLTELLTVVALSIGMGYLSWRFFESPLRNPRKVPRKNFIWIISSWAIVLLACGLIFHFSKGMPSRFFGAMARDTAAGMQIRYNERAFSYQQNQFKFKDKPHVLVVGNSFARDFVNIIFESGLAKDTELIYREQFPNCLKNGKVAPETLSLIEQSDTVIFGSGGFAGQCIHDNIKYLESHGINTVLFIGTKDFGYNLDVFFRLPWTERAEITVSIREEARLMNQWMKALIPDHRYVDLIGIIGKDGNTMPAFDENGLPLSLDRKHLTQSGARYFAKRVFAEKPLNLLWNDSMTPNPQTPQSSNSNETTVTPNE